MPFYSEYAERIWERLYTVYIPDLLTQNPDYIKKFGVYITQDSKIDAMIKTNLTLVKIPIITILEYYESGIPVEIPNRKDMVQIHKDIELYLAEWGEYIKGSIHGQMDAQNNKELITALEKLSKYIYSKTVSSEVLDNLFLKNNRNINLGLINPLKEAEFRNEIKEKPDYVGIRGLINRKRKDGDSGGRF